MTPRPWLLTFKHTPTNLVITYTVIAKSGWDALERLRKDRQDISHFNELVDTVEMDYLLIEPLHVSGDHSSRTTPGETPPAPTRGDGD